MRVQCPECKTVTGGTAGFCGSCGLRFAAYSAAVIRKERSRQECAIAILTGLTIAVVRYMLQSSL